ncbi:MAG TPA: DUF3108 domain-containing protein [Pyrinomonadaceae bacterium]|nr:DUF3108 domain-containing protein [Pyrinomonadaceae bacterium]
MSSPKKVERELISKRRSLLGCAGLLTLLLLCVPTYAQSGNGMATPFSAPSYRVGERLTYNVSFSNFPTAAHAELRVGNRGNFYGRDGIELRAHVKTIGVVGAALYSIDDDFVSYVDPATGLSFRSQQLKHDDAPLGDGPSPDGSEPPVEQKPSEFVGASDLLSALYRARSLPLSPGVVHPFVVQYDAIEYRAELKVAGRQLLRTNIGSFNTIVAHVRVPGNKEINAYRLQFHFTDDELHIPVLVTAQLAAGEIRAEIASAEVIAAPPITPLVATTPGANSTTNPPVQPIDPRAVRYPAGAALPGLPFTAGEELNFNFFVGEQPQAIGKASLQVRPRGRYFNQDGLMLAAVLETTGAGQRLFPVNDQITSYVDASTLLPFRTELKLQEGRRRTNWAVSSKQELGTATFDDGTRLEIPVGTHDLISVFYALRSFDLTPPKRNAVSLLINKRPRLLIVTALQRQTIEVGGQRIPAVQLSLLTDDAQGDRFAMRLWVTTDARRLPVRLTATTPFGPLRADLAILPVSLQ